MSSQDGAQPLLRLGSAERTLGNIGIGEPARQADDDAFSTSTLRPGAATWQPDSDAEQCTQCRSLFQYPLRRRHHCRQCGKVVCSKCSPTRQLVPEFHPTKPQRVCKGCSQLCQPVLLPDSEPPLQGSEGTGDDHPAVGGSGRAPCMMCTLMGPVPSGLPSDFGILRLSIIEAKGLAAMDVNWRGRASTSDPYCVVGLEGGQMLKTRHISSTLEPKWDEEVSFRLARSNSTLCLQLFDYDMASNDDLIASLKLPLGEMRPGRKARGWVPLTPADGEDGPGGGVLLEMELKAFDSQRHLMSYVVPPPGVPTPPAAFDINAVYAPSMHLMDLLWTRLGAPVLFALLDLIFWTYPKRSFLVLLIWNVAAAWLLDHWPALLLILLAMYILSWRSLKARFDPAETYVLENVNAAGKYLNVQAGSTANRANIQLWDNPGSADSCWRVRRSNGVYVIENVNAAGKYVSVAGGKTANGGNVCLSDNPESVRSQWRIAERSRGVFTLESVHAEAKYMNVVGGWTENGSNIHAWDNPGSSESQWRIVKQPAAAGNSGPSGKPKQMASRQNSNSQEKKPAEDQKSDQQQLGSFVTIVAKVAPKSVKELCVTFAPLLRLVADLCQLVHDLCTWEHPSSPAAVGALLAAALFCELVPFRCLVMLVGSAVLLALSPLLTAALGLVSYVQWRWGTLNEKQSLNMHPEYLPEWSSSSS